MDIINGDLQNLEIHEDLFKNIKFFISGQIPEKIIELLKTGGAERNNYFSDYVTHLIVGTNPEENDIVDANDLYEIPAITPKWIVICIKLKKLVSTKPYLYNTQKLFTNLTFCLSKVGDDRNLLWALITHNGGRAVLRLTPKCTHLVTLDTKSQKYAKASSLASDRIRIVTPDWVIEAVKNKSMPDANLFHPKLIQWTRGIKHESTTASITGFEPEAGDSSAKIEEENVADSTNALLEKLKQRMAFNRPQADIIPPPNVVAPSFLNKTHAGNQMNQVRPLVPLQQQQQQPQQQPQNPPIYSNQMQPAQQIPRSIVHHTPQNTFQTQQPQMQQQQAPQQQHQLQQQPNLVGRLVNQQPMIRGQLNNQQLQQQLLQQRINQQRVNPQQQQQLLQQQQQQRQQLLQNQNNQTQLINQNQIIPQNNPDLNKNQQILQIQQQQIQVKQQMQLNPNCQQLLQNSPKQGFPQQQQQILVTQQQKQLFSPTSSPQAGQQFVSQSFQPELNQVPPQQILQQQQNVQHQLLQQQQQPQLNQQPQLLNPQQQQIKQPQFVQQTAINQQLIQQQQQQLLQPMDQQPATLNQFQPQQNVINPQQQQQQVLLNQQNPQVRPQLSQHLWQQQPPQQQIVNVVQQAPGARLQWSPTQQQQPQQAQQGGIIPQRQFIHLDQQTHNQLQKMPPEQRALFVAKLQKQRIVRQVQQRGGSHILIRGAVPAGLSTQQQVQWLQQQARQQGIVLPPNIQQQNITPGTLTTQNPNTAQTIQQTVQQQQPPQHGAPGLSPIQQNPPQFGDQNQQQQLQMRQYRLQQLQLQREQVQKTHMVQQQAQQPAQPPQQQGAVPQQNILRPIGQPPVADPSNAAAPAAQAIQDNQVQHSLVVNAKTKTALANMLSIKLQSGGSAMGPRSDAIQEPSAAGTLRLLTAHHHANLNPNARPQDIAMAIQHRRVINGPNGEIIRAPGTPVVPMQTTEPPKLQYGQRPAVPLQHRPGPFYGHNPNLKLPPDLFLLGCIFVVVEIEKYLDEAIPDWQKRIEKHGGEVEKQYCTRVTHVLCETQRHGVVMQALRDSKRCVTIYWLSDVMKSKHVLPPWAALHLPTIYLDIAPASKHLMSLSGFEGSERTKIKHMIKYTGAKFTPYFSKHNTILIASKNDGNKFAYAKKWNIPVVNVQWLTDVMLGHFPALNQTENQLYQQFIQPSNFNFDPKLVPNLMHSWKMPINISQDSYERVKRSASPILLPKKAKKPKLEQTDENDNINEEMTSTHRILVSMFPNMDQMKKMVKDLNGSMAKSYQDCTHLVMPHLARSNKLLYCLCRGDVHIVPEKWLTDSHSANHFLPESNYVLDTKDFNSEYRCDFAQTLATKCKNRLFEGRYFWITPSVYPNKKFLTELVHLCGGVVEKCRRSAAQIEATNLNSPYSYIILTHENDLHLVADLLKNKKDKNRIICSVELVFSAILKQTFEVESFAVRIL